MSLQKDVNNGFPIANIGLMDGENPNELSLESPRHGYPRRYNPMTAVSKQEHGECPARCRKQAGCIYTHNRIHKLAYDV